MNCIIGKNGSGKSAICIAAQVVFGASARDTGRGTSTKQYVRNGCPHFVVQVHIRNPDDDLPGAFKRVLPPPP